VSNDDLDSQQWFEEIEDYLRRVAQENDETRELGEEEYQEHLEEIDEPDEEDKDEAEEEALETVQDEIEEIPTEEIEDDEHLAPGNQPEDGWEKIHTFMTYDEARTYCAPAPVGVLFIVMLENGDFDVYRDPDYGQVSV
jgi:uncharacterized protein YhaN